jgi:hypothetical protein
MQKSETIGALAAALAKAQSKMTFAAKDSLNPHFKNRYADLAAVLDAVRGPLTANGLAVVQLVAEAERGAALETVLMHESGEWIASFYSLPVNKEDAQGYGSSLTYARRYALAAICGIAQDDDDGEGARKAPDARQAAQANAPKARTHEQVESIVAGLASLGIKEAEQGALVKRLAGKLSPTSYDGAEEVIAGLSRMLDEKRTKERGA